MGTQLLAAIEKTVRQMLLDEYEEDVDLTWEKDEIIVHIRQCVRELSRARPRLVKEVKTTIANSKVLDISAITDLLDGAYSIKYAEYKIGKSPRQERAVKVLDEDQIEILTDTTPSAGGSGTLTGTVTFTSGSAAVTGSGTDFDGELEADYLIKKAVSGSSGRWYRVYSVTDDTNIVLAEPVTPDDNGADTENLTEYCYEAVYLYCEKLHTLTNSASTLSAEQEELIVHGACGLAAISKAQSLINKVNIGGTRTPADMQSWGNNHYAIFKAGIAATRKTRISRRYPTD